MERGPYFQNALLSGDVPLLTGFDAQPVLDSNGRPKMIAGASALVAHLRRKDGTDAALRIVASPSTPRDWAVRYAALAQLGRKGQFRRIPGAITPVQPQHWTTNTEAFVDASIVTMEWIGGPTLLAAVDRASQAGNRAVLQALHKGLVQVWNDLQGHRVTHGDLTGQNIMVRNDGQLVLVDLDTASWPDAPFGTPGSGSAGYRPPSGTRNAKERDAFATLVMLVSLQVLSESPGFWAHEGRARFRSRGALLFGEADLARLASSPLFTAAQRTVSPQTEDLLNALEAATQGGLPAINEALAAIPGIQSAADQNNGGSDAGWNVAPIVERMRAHYTDTWNQPEPEPGPSASESTWQNANWPRTSDVTWPTIPEPTRPEPAPTPSAATAGDISDLRAASQRKDAAEVLRLWANLQSDDVAPLVALDVEVVESASLQRGIAEAARQKHDQQVVDLAAEAFYRGFPLDTRTRQLVREATERLEIGSLLGEALSQGDAETLAELALTGQLAQAGETDRQSLQQVLQAIELPQLRRALEADDDLLILEAVDDELFGGDDEISQRVAARVDLARRRREWLQQARAGLKRRNPTALLDLLVSPPEGAVERLSSPERRRMRQVIEGQKALDDLDRALTSGNDAAVVSALNRVERAGARIPERKTWASIQEVLERMSVVDSLLAAASEQPPDVATLTQLLPTVKAMGLHRDRRLTPELIASIESLLSRMAHLHRIRAAIKRDNDIAIVTAAVPDEHGAMDLLSADEQRRVEQAIAARRRTSRTTTAG